MRGVATVPRSSDDDVKQRLCYHGFWLPCRQGNSPFKVNKRQRTPVRAAKVKTPSPSPCRVFTDSMFNIDLSMRDDLERVSNNQNEDGTSYSDDSNENLSYKSLLTLCNTDTFKDLPISLYNLRRAKSLSELSIMKDSYQ
ncbi:hypothetical protein NPIL_394441 [Nephila pilipes]|uniref:Uncharacterized protein n=1 Tax=Nephila pilipes TaxID=299642 RepID=A0A8X6MY26_NEPPI|nr:hypothetical protein NPIL_394441 [Nephila pilipes]